MQKPQKISYSWLLPLGITLLTLSALMYFAIKEEKNLQYENLEEVFEQRLWSSERVANRINQTLNKTAASIKQLSHHLSSELTTTKLYPPERFESLFETLHDQSIRSKKINFNGQNQAGVWLPKFKFINRKDKNQLLIAKQIVETYGQGAKELPFVNTWFMPSDGGIVIYWPDEINFIYQASSNFTYADTPWLLDASPVNNPTRQSYWTPLILDPIPQIWMLSAVAPIYIHGQWAGSVGHDIPLNNLIKDTKPLEEREGSEFILVSSNNQIVASNTYRNLITSNGSSLKISNLTEPHWKEVLDRYKKDKITSSRYHIDNKLFTVSYIQHKGWLLLTSMPVLPAQQKIAEAFLNLRIIIISTILMGVLIVMILLGRGNRRDNKLLEEQSRYKNLVDNVPSMVYQCNIDSQWTMNFLNGSSQSITGYSASELLNNNQVSFESIIYEEDRNLVRQVVDKALNNNESYEIVYRIIHKDGYLCWVLERGQINNAGESAILEGVITDINKLKEAELSLKSMNHNLDYLIKERTHDLESANSKLNTKALALETSLRQLKEAQKKLIETEKIVSLGNLVVGMSHELNTPLGNLLMVGSLLESSVSDTKEKMATNNLQRSSLDNFLTAVKDANDSLLINTEKLVILSERFKEIAVLDVKNTRRSIRLKDEINKTLFDLDYDIQQKSINVELNIANNITINAYPLSISKVFYHLIKNSIEHGFKKNISKNINISCELQSQSIIIYYDDNGRGISKELQDKIFEPFSTDARGKGHIGLGMNIVFNLVTESLRGTIKCVSYENGAKFVITIPIGST